MASLDYLRRKAFVNALVAETKLEYRENDETAYGICEHGVITMPPYRSDFSDIQDHHWMMQLLNNCYHNTGNNSDDLRSIARHGIDFNTEFGQGYLIVLRHNVQFKRQGILPGADQYVNTASHESHLQFVEDNLNPELEMLPPDVEAVKAFDMIARSKWQLSTDYEVRDSLSPEGRKKLDKLMASPGLMHDYLTERPGGQENIDLTKRMIEEMNNDDMTGEGGDQVAEDKFDEACKGNDGDQQQQGQANGAGKGRGEDGPSGEGKGEADGSPRTSDDEADYRKLNECHSGFGADEVGGNQTIHYKDTDFQTEGNFIPMPTKVVRPLESSNSEGGYYGGASHRKDDIKDKMSGSLSTKVRNILKVFSQARYRGGQKRGRINKRAIASIKSGNDRIFRTKTQKDVLDTAVCVLVDTSGSMHGSRYSHATASAAMLNECLAKLNIPHAIYGFTNCGDHNRNDQWYGARNLIFEHKRFNESVTPDDVINSFCAKSVSLASNDDGEALMWAHDQLIKQKQKRKVLIVLSDGQPAGNNPLHNEVAYLKHVTQEIENKSPVELYGIGIETKSVEKFYTNSTVLKDTSQLEETLLTTIKSSIIG